VHRLIAILALSMLAACQSGTHPVFSPAPPSPTPSNSPTAAILQSADVPPGLKVCLGSGPIDVYVASLAHADPSLATKAATQWQHLVDQGATGGAISLFTASPAACNAELGATSNVKSVTSFVAIFADAAQADRAWGSGVFGFRPPASGEILSGAVRGTDTGLGLSSWTYDHSNIRLASWHRSVFVALVVVANLDVAAFKAATAAIDARLN
jgi:hypothetical protein